MEKVLFIGIATVLFCVFVYKFWEWLDSWMGDGTTIDFDEERRKKLHK
jgi:hypothetical protein